MQKYVLPPFLESYCTPKAYRRWLDRAAIRHYKRDKKRGNITASRREYKQAIHEAVLLQGGRDAYTGKQLRWDLISSYDNRKAKQQGRAYKKEFGDLPTVDHVGDGTGPPDLRICSWRVNDCKNDLNLDEFLDVCRSVLNFETAGEKRAT